MCISIIIKYKKLDGEKDGHLDKADGGKVGY